MNFVFHSGPMNREHLATLQTGCLVVGLHTDELKGIAHDIDLQTDGLIGRLLDSNELPKEPGKCVVLHEPRNLQARRILLVSLGPTAEMTAKRWLACLRAAAETLKAVKCEEALWCLSAYPAKPDLEDPLLASVLAIREATYRFASRTSKADDECARALHLVRLLLPPSTPAPEPVLLQALAIADGLDLCRDLGNLPPNICTPTYLADASSVLGEIVNVDVTVMEKEHIATLGMNAFLAVAKGSVEAPRFIVINYTGGGSEQPVVLVGKGITFDSGGISIKPGEAMDEMKYDMCGAASVIGTMRAVTQMKLPINLIGVIAACENMPGPNALRPGDVITSMAGKTIEVLNTDAEGRLILCDALTYVERFNPAVVVDVATLTGACIVALGHVHSALYANDEYLAQTLSNAAKSSGDTVWRMPLDDAYQEQLKSNFADLPNIGTKGAGSVTASCFLSHFTQSYPWAHLDIAGTAWRSGPQKGATGRPVRLLTQFLLNRVANHSV